MAQDKQEEVTIIEELDGQKILSAQLISGPEGERLVFLLEGEQRAVIKPRQEEGRPCLLFEFPEPS